METPLANAAKRGGAFVSLPKTHVPLFSKPSDCKYFRTSGPLSATEPASARPKPSKIDFLPSSRTSSGICAKVVSATNWATYLVTPSTSGNGAGQGDGASEEYPFAFESRPATVARADPETKSRLFMTQ